MSEDGRSQVLIYLTTLTRLKLLYIFMVEKTCIIYHAFLMLSSKGHQPAFIQNAPFYKVQIKPRLVSFLVSRGGFHLPVGVFNVKAETQSVCIRANVFAKTSKPFSNQQKS